MTKQELTTVDNAISKLFEVLRIINDGELAFELSEAQRECVKASKETGKKSEFTLKLVIDPDSKSDAFRVSGTVKTKLPAPPVRGSLFFPTPEDNLSRQDRKQRDMFEEQHQQHQTQ